MKDKVLQVLLLTLASVLLMAGLVKTAQASGESINVQANQTVAVQKEVRGFADHPVHLGKADQLFATSIETVKSAENIEDMAAIYEKDGGCD